MDSQNAHTPNSFLDILDSLGIDDPRLRKMAEFMSQRSAFQASPRSIEEELSQKQRELAQIEKLVHENQELLEENQTLRERIEILAAALGACPYCWGENNSCPTCQGKGNPGSFMPDRGAYSGYVLPAVQVIRRYTRLPNPSKSESVGQK
ncbi:MAG: hypothetical protein HY697_03500 [Deltaproteobacteria bacterium]|nr:hypothetical protein [Deltaproteobacteria bacterium]